LLSLLVATAWLTIPGLINHLLIAPAGNHLVVGSLSNLIKNTITVSTYFLANGVRVGATISVAAACWLIINHCFANWDREHHRQQNSTNTALSVAYCLSKPPPHRQFGIRPGKPFGSQSLINNCNNTRTQRHTRLVIYYASLLGVRLSYCFISLLHLRTRHANIIINWHLVPILSANS